MGSFNRTLSTEQRVALRALIANPIYELVPVAGVDDAAAALPVHATVSVTALPRLGVDATLQLSERLAVLGHDVCPHLSARSLRDRAHLADVLARLRHAGIGKLFVVGGDEAVTGEFPDGLALLRAIAELPSWFHAIGVPSYPEGHPIVRDDVLLDDLRAKQRHAQATTTQMSFNPGAVTAWIARMRAEGIELPIHLGVPGVLRLGRLTTIGARIGVADSTRYLLKHRALVGRLVQRGSFAPDGLLAALAPTLADPAANVRALHLFTMNQVAETVQFVKTMTDELGA